MTQKKKFVLLSLILCFSSVALGSFMVQKYHHKISFIDKFYTTYIEIPTTSAYPFKGLMEEPNNPSGVYYQNRVLVLMYHDIDPNPTDIGALSLANFEKQLELMRDNNFHWITMDQYRDFILHGASVPDNAVLLTFDDGYASFYKYAFPILQQYQAPATNFLIVNTIDNPDHKGIPKVTWDQVRLMHKSGIDFYSHTFDSHKYAPVDARNEKKAIALMSGPIYLTKEDRLESQVEYEQRIADDLKHANEVLYQQLGILNDVLAFPYGGFSKSTLRVSEQVGIPITLSVYNGLNKPGQFNGYRINAGGMTNDPALQLSLMKQAQKLLGHKSFSDASRARHITIAGLTTVSILGIWWLMTGWKLLTVRKRRQ